MVTTMNAAAHPRPAGRPARRRPRRSSPTLALEAPPGANGVDPPALLRRRAHPQPTRTPSAPGPGCGRPRPAPTSPGRRTRRCSARSPTPSTSSSAQHRRRSRAGCCWSAAPRAAPRCARWPRRSSAGPVALPPPGEYVALGAARQAAWALAGTAEPPRGRARRCESRSRPTPSPTSASATPSCATRTETWTWNPPDQPPPEGITMSIEIPTPTPEDKFSFGLWTVGWQGRDPFGERDPRRRWTRARAGEAGRARRLRRQLPRRRPHPVRQRRRRPATRSSSASRKGLADTGLVVTTATTNLFTHPVFKDGAFTSNDRDVRRFALRKVMRNLDLAAELGAKIYVVLGWPRGLPSTAPPRTSRSALDRYKEAFDVLGQYVVDQGYDLRFAIEPKPNEPRGDILLPTIGHALAFIETLERPELGRREPGDRARGDGRHERGRGLRPGAVARASSSTSTSTARTARSSTRTCASAPATCAAPSGSSTPCSPAATTARCTSTTSRRAPRTRTACGSSAKASMTNYLILREKVRAFRADPEVQAALEAARVPELARADPRRTARPGSSCSTGRCPTSRRWPPAGWRPSTSTSSRSSTSTASAADERLVSDAGRRQHRAAPAAATPSLGAARLRTGGPATRAELAQRTGLAKATVGVIVADLEADGARGRGAELAAGARGRPGASGGPARRPVRRPRAWSSTSTTSRRSSSTSRAGGPARDAGPSVRTDRRGALTQLAAATAARIARRHSDSVLVGAVVAVPGLVRGDDRTVAWAPNVDLDGRRARRPRLERALGGQLSGARSATTPTARRTPRRTTAPRPTADHAALPDRHRRHRRRHRRGRRRWSAAATGFAGEVGHMPVGDSDAPCGCGRRGCWEASIGLHAMLARGRDARARHPAGHRPRRWRRGPGPTRGSATGSRGSAATSASAWRCWPPCSTPPSSCWAATSSRWATWSSAPARRTLDERLVSAGPAAPGAAARRPRHPRPPRSAPPSGRSRDVFAGELDLPV